MSFFAGTTDGGFKIFVIDSGIITRQVGCSPCSAIPVVYNWCPFIGLEGTGSATNPADTAQRAPVLAAQILAFRTAFPRTIIQ